MKRILFIIASVVFVLGIAFGVYYFFFASKDLPLDVSDALFQGSGDAPEVDIPTGPEGEVISEAGDEFAQRLIRITESPVALGAAAVALPPTATDISPQGEVEIRYIDRASGNTYAFRAYERTLTRINNRTLPGVQKASWLSDGSGAFVTYLTGPVLGDLETFFLPAEGEGGYVLERGLSQIIVSGTSTLITLLPKEQGSVATAARPDGTSPKTLFTTALTNIRLYASDGPFIIATKASSALDGYAFTVASQGELTRILGPHRGLTVLPNNSGKTVLYSYLSEGILKLATYDMATGATKQLPIATIADKCVWTLDDKYVYCAVPKNIPSGIPDSWYQGTVQFADRFWEIDMVNEFATLKFDPSQLAEIDIDATGLSLDSRNDWLVFRNKIDGSLWVYDL